MAKPLTITMLEDFQGSPDGVQVLDYGKGERITFTTPGGVDLGRVFLEIGVAERYVEPGPVPAAKQMPKPEDKQRKKPATKAASAAAPRQRKGRGR